MKWDKLDMSVEGLLSRAKRKAPNQIYRKREEQILVGWVIYQDLAMRSSKFQIQRVCDLKSLDDYYYYYYYNYYYYYYYYCSAICN
jgi:hypothetical protein